MAVKWTDNQKDAIDARGASFIVSAAAGSGKTAVLTERLINLISDPESGVRADRIVVVTFTNDAAAELKKRLDKKLREMIELNPDNTYLLRQQVLLQNAKISTINSFCFELLRDNITNQGITSGFGILDENDEAVIKSQAMDELLDFYSNEEYEKISQLYDKFCVKNQNPLISAILTADKFLSSVALSRKWLDTAVNEYKKPFEQSVYYEALFENTAKKLRIAVKLAEDNLAAVRQIFPDMTVKQAKDSEIQAAFELEKAELILKIAESRRFPTNDEQTAVQKFDRLVTVGKKIVHNAAVREIFKARRDKLKNILISAVNGLSSAYSDYEESASAAVLLCEAVEKFREIVWEKKCAKNAISFDDGERLTLELLADYDEDGNIIQSETAERIADFYDVIMIDEYQDSNNKQDMIFKLMSKGYRNGRYGTNAFLVGDVKQSIYRFRLANPKNFIEAMACAEMYSSDSTAENQSILLNMNFRSSPEVIDFVNFIFSGIMTRECGDIDYTDDERLYFGASQYAKPFDGNRRTHINFIDTDENESENDDGDEAERTESIEAEITAGKIADMIKNGAPVIESDGTVRPCTPKDFCILVRKNNYTSIYVKALEKRGIPAKGSDEKGYLKSQEIAVLTDLLRIIANPLKDIPMAAVMVSPMYPFSISDLAYIKSFGCKTPLFTLLKQIVSGEFDDFDTSLAVQCRQFIESIDRFRMNSITMTIGELINSIYDETDFISVMQQYIDGDRKRANLRILIQYAHNYESLAAVDGSGGLSGFIRHIDRVIENGDYNQGKVSASSGDYAVVQTLHKSKGLEYPFVFIAETSTKFKFDSNIVMCSDDGRIGFILYDKSLVRKYKTFQQIMLCNEGRSDSRSEEMRLLYVGLTRAKQQLFINLKCGEKAKQRVNSLVSECIVNGNDISSLVSQAGSFSDWFWLCLMMHSEFPAIAELVGLDCDFGFPAYDCDQQIFDFELCRNTDKTGFSAESVQYPDADPKIVSELRNIINSSYDRTLSETTAKLSVTEISRKFTEEKEFDFHLKRPKFISGKGKLTGAERGTAIHTFFQYCNFDNAVNDTAAETERLRVSGFLTAAQAASINPRKVRAFFRSPLYARIKNSVHYEREKKFTVAAGELAISDSVFDRLKNSDGMIKGIIDLMYEEDDGIVIVDYKSDRGTPAEKLRERYSKQLEIYKAALELTTGKAVKGLSLYSIELEREIVIR